MAAPSEVRRVFLTLWPNANTREALDRLARELEGPGRRVPRDHLHLTLAFAGTVPTGHADCLIEHLPTLAGSPIDLDMDRLGHFAGPRVTWVGPRATPPALEDLAKRAHTLCEECGIDLGPPRDFRPHVTLRRHARPPASEQVAAPVHWRADCVALIESGANGQPGPYRVLGRV